VNGYQKHAAQYAVRGLWKYVGDRAVRIDPAGKYWEPLKTAERLGWCKWTGDRCVLTPSGVSLAVEYITPAEAAD